MKDTLHELRKELAASIGRVRTLADEMLSKGILSKAERAKVDKMLEKPRTIEERELEKELARVASVESVLDDLKSPDDLLSRDEWEDYQKVLRERLDDPFGRDRAYLKEVQEFKKLETMILAGDDEREVHIKIAATWPIHRIFDALYSCFIYEAEEANVPIVLEMLSGLLEEANAYMGAYVYAKHDGEFDFLKNVDLHLADLTIDELKEKIPPSIAKTIETLQEGIRAFCEDSRAGRIASENAEHAAENAKHYAALAAAKTKKEFDDLSQKGHAGAKEANKYKRENHVAVTMRGIVDDVLAKIREWDNEGGSDPAHTENAAIKTICLNHTQFFTIPPGYDSNYKAQLNKAMARVKKALQRRRKETRGKRKP